MKKKYRALVEGRWVLESRAKFDEFQTLDLERMLQEFGNHALRAAKENPEILENMVIPEPSMEVRK